MLYEGHEYESNISSSTISRVVEVPIDSDYQIASISTFSHGICIFSSL